MLRRARNRMTGESGNVLITVVLVSMLIGALAAAALQTGEHADSSAARDRNYQVALGVAESGVHDAIAQINDEPSAYDGCTTPGACTITASTPEGDYRLEVTRIDDGFVLDSGAETGGEILGRERRIRVTLLPPRLFDGSYALFSSTALDIKNGDQISGDVWANDSVIARNLSRVGGSVTAATSWIALEENAGIDGFAWSGGFNSATGKSISMANGSKIGAWAKASVSSPSDPETCDAEVSEQANYDVAMYGSATIGEEVTTWGEIDPDNGNHGTVLVHECTSAPPIKPIPSFNYDPDNYDPAPQEFSSAESFQDWLLEPGNADALQGTFHVDEATPSQTDRPPAATPHRINLTGATVAGDLTIVTNAPVTTAGMDDDGVGADGAVVVIVSHYDPPTGTSCDVNQDSSECAIHVGNAFAFDDGTCKTAVLLYADNGPVSVKNNQGMCGSIISESIIIKNNQELTYDERIDRLLGFGPVTYEIALWEECLLSGCAP